MKVDVNIVDVEKDVDMVKVEFWQILEETEGGF
jgi:hypothetical protein